jgi:hypothetical protein
MTAEKASGCTKSERIKVFRRFVSRSIKYAASFLSLFDKRCSLRRADAAQIAGYSNTRDFVALCTRKEEETGIAECAINSRLEALGST